MSKLTNWIDETDSLDIQGIVDKYEADLLKKENKTQSIKKETVVLDGQEIWSGSLEDFAHQTKAAPAEIEKPKVEEAKHKEVIIETKPENNKTSLFNIDVDKTSETKHTVDPKRPEVPKFEIPNIKPSIPNEVIKTLEEKIEAKLPVEEKQAPKTVEFKIPDLFDKNTRTLEEPKANIEESKESSKTVSLFDTIKVPEEPKQAEPVHSYKDEMVKKQLNELAKAKAELEAANELVKKQLAEMAKAREEFEASKKQEAPAPSFMDNKTISFDNVQKESKDEIRLENPDTKILDEEPVKVSKGKTIKFVDQDETKESETKNEALNKFGIKSDYYKAFEANDCKTVRFQPTTSQLSKEEASTEKEEPVNKFTKRLTKIFFNETQKADDLDLTKELDHSKGISVEETQHSNTKKKKGFFHLFSKKKVNN